MSGRQARHKVRAPPPPQSGQINKREAGVKNVHGWARQARKNCSVGEGSGRR